MAVVGVCKLVFFFFFFIQPEFFCIVRLLSVPPIKQWTCNNGRNCYARVELYTLSILIQFCQETQRDQLILYLQLNILLIFLSIY